MLMVSGGCPDASAAIPKAMGSPRCTGFGGLEAPITTDSFNGSKLVPCPVLALAQARKNDFVVAHDNKTVGITRKYRVNPNADSMVHAKTSGALKGLLEGSWTTRLDRIHRRGGKFL